MPGFVVDVSADVRLVGEGIEAPAEHRLLEATLIPAGVSQWTLRPNL